MLNLLKERVYEKMNILCNYKQQTIFENYQNSEEDDIEIYEIIIKMPLNRFRIYKGTRYKSSISVEYFTLEEDMMKAMMGEVASNE